MVKLLCVILVRLSKSIKGDFSTLLGFLRDFFLLLLTETDTSAANLICIHFHTGRGFITLEDLYKAFNEVAPHTPRHRIDSLFR